MSNGLEGTWTARIVSVEFRDDYGTINFAFNKFKGRRTDDNGNTENHSATAYAVGFVRDNLLNLVRAYPELFSKGNEVEVTGYLETRVSEYEGRKNSTLALRVTDLAASSRTLLKAKGIELVKRSYNSGQNSTGSNQQSNQQNSGWGGGSSQQSAPSYNNQSAAPQQQSSGGGGDPWGGGSSDSNEDPWG